ncbi:MAG: hypothetical protein A2W31_00725 [Planctomycetes bacterium RBG_16_64_10]|nr:MAG: hypothetical protein A2W31_00725 [Planctomycetes bacterium RBG_16_64_10]
MPSSFAHVASIDAIRSIRAALLRFAEDALEALGALDLEIGRGVDHIQHDQMAYWPQQVRQAWDEIAEARVVLHQRRAISVAGHRPACDEEKKALAAAQRRLQTAQDKVETVRNWCRKLNQEVEEYQGRIGHFRQLIETELPRAIGTLDHMLSALDAYTAVGTPRHDTTPRRSVARSEGQPEQDAEPPSQRHPESDAETAGGAVPTDPANGPPSDNQP